MQSDTKGHILYDSIYININNRQIHRDRKKISISQVGGGKNEEKLLNGVRVFFWGNENVLELERSAQHCECAKRH